MNTTARHLLIASYESVVVACGSYVLLTMQSLLFGLVTYLEAIYLDIKTLFAQIDRLSERKLIKPKDTCLPRRENLDLQMRERCNEAINLHQKMNRYFAQQQNPPNFRPRQYLEHSITTEMLHFFAAYFLNNRGNIPRKRRIRMLQILSATTLIFDSFQTHAQPGRCNEFHHPDNDNALGIECMLFTAYGGEGDKKYFVHFS